MAVLAQEVTTVVCETQANIDAQEYFLLYGMGSDFEENSYHVWFNKGGSDADPAPSGSTGIECNISGATSASDVGAIVVTQVGGNADFGASNNSGTVTITNAVRGSVTDASNVNIGGRYIPLENNVKLPSRILGYFFSHKYWHNQREFLLETFEPNQKIKDYIQNKYSKLFEKNTVSVHLRLGHQNDPAGEVNHVSMNQNYPDYYKKSLALFEDKYNN